MTRQPKTGGSTSRQQGAHLRSQMKTSSPGLCVVTPPPSFTEYRYRFNLAVTAGGIL